MISVVCPFYNEEKIVAASVRLMQQNLASLPEEWELIVVNDGSTDRSLEIVQALQGENPRLRVVSYPLNRGRGFAIRSGVGAARGRIVVTTEIDSSWGDDIVHRIVDGFTQHPDADMIVASPHLPAGGYRNVPAHRVFFSTAGNMIIRAALTRQVTMNTGMTRGYLRERFLQLPLDEPEKEMHLEIIQKAKAFGYKIYEIPAVLEWKDHKLGSDAAPKRKSSSRIPHLINSHLAFSILAAPFRYLFVISGLLFLGALFFFSWSVYNLLHPERHQPAIYVLLVSFFLGLFGFLLFSISALAHQNYTVLKELWRVRALLSGAMPQAFRDEEEPPLRAPDEAADVKVPVQFSSR